MTATGSNRLIERWFPSMELSRLVMADRRSKDPVYGLHRWFARRPPTLVRALLLAAHLPADISSTDFWTMHESPDLWLDGAQVYDPFMGGGTSLVEAARMGAAVFGRDVDPLACSLVSAELDRQPRGQATVAARELVSDLTRRFGDLYGGLGDPWTPLHWFWLRRASCPACDSKNMVYRDLILARSLGHVGSVVRDVDVYAFCPECLDVHSLDRKRKTVRCCGRRRPLGKGTFVDGKFHCPDCSAVSSYEAIRPGRAERVLVAVEETQPGMRRRIRAARPADLQQSLSSGSTPDGSNYDRPLDLIRRDRRPVSLGFDRASSMHSNRQWDVFVAAFEWIDESGCTESLKNTLRLAISAILPSNNLLCGYARDYGRLSPLFSVRGYSLPPLSTELNLFHPTAGRGTFAAAIRRVENLDTEAVQRHKLHAGRPSKTAINLPVRPRSTNIVCASAEDTDVQPELLADICVTDPPYFDYIAYSELSEFFRGWLADPSLGGAPLLPEGEDPVGSFADRLAAILKVTLSRLLPTTPVVFTYHSRHQAAWSAIGAALDESNLVLTALWPVVADPQMGHHSGGGNCEWDLVLVCRPRQPGLEPRPTPRLADWQIEAEHQGLRINQADCASFAAAIEMATGRYYAHQPSAG